MDITKLYQTQVSLTEWLAGIDHEQAEALRIEDNDKRERLKVLNRLVGLPFDAPQQFPAEAISNNSPAFQTFLKEHGHELCALRLIPLDPKLPKLRMRGHTIQDALKWFREQKIDPAQYKADFVPHSEKSLWSTIFIVNQQGIFGEIISGGHHQLTQGIYEKDGPITFSYDWQEWRLIPENKEAIEELQRIARYLHVKEASSRNLLKEQLDAKFFNNHLLGYFETVTSEEFGLWFIDYNRLLGEMYSDYSIFHSATEGEAFLRGQIGHKGKATGKVRIIRNNELGEATLAPSEILVCPMTTPEYLSLIQKSAGVVTDQGGVLSHAAITCRELGKPCVVGTKNATKLLKDGDMIELDNGIVRKLS